MRGFIDVDTTEPPKKDPREVLDQEKRRPNRVLCVVFGDGPDVDAIQDQASEIAGKKQCAPVRVLRVRNDAILDSGKDPDEPSWKHPAGTGLTLLRFNQSVVSSKMTLAQASDAGDLFNAMLAAIAGRTWP